ncbi:hypothetical protein pEaSNUABM54_00058 [Erwinia phage pEa_SNUABM_54]|nr:hypothetical protein pEaSNUABM54_00058 [Erwinia phage pEa_SNUABM_54]
MYKYIQGTAEAIGMPGVWDPANLGTLTFAQIFQRYTGAVAIVEVVEISTRYSLDLWALPTTLRQLPITLSNWLTSVGNDMIPISEAIPSKSRLYATYRDLWNAGFQVQGYNRNISEKQVLLSDQIIDAKVTKSDVNYATLDKYSLFVVNGLVHFSTAIDTGIIVADAGRSLSKADDNRIGVINFEKIGVVSRIPITDKMIVTNPSDLPLKETVYLSLGNVDLTSKTVGVVIGGHLHLLDGAYDQVGTNLLKIHMREYPLVDRYWELKGKTDVSSIKITPFENRVDKLDFTELTSDANIKALLKLSQSFVVTIEAQNIGVEKLQVHQAELAGRFVAYEEPRYPIMNDTGAFSNYSWYKAKHDWVIRTSDYQYTNYMRTTTEYKLQRYVTNHRYVHRPTQYHDSFWWKLYKVVD